MIRRFTAELGEVSWAKACASHASAGHVLCLAQAKDEGILIEAVHHQKEVQEYVRVGDMNVHVPIHAGIAAVGFPPEERRKIFERNGFITKLDFYNLVHVMKLQQGRRAQGLPVVPISVNQSRFHMQEKGYLQRMKELVGIYSTDGVELELTETAFDLAGRDQRENALAVVTELKRLGFCIDMDDFGTGYSDMTLLDALPLDVMKLDRSLLLDDRSRPRARHDRHLRRHRDGRTGADAHRLRLRARPGLPLRQAYAAGRIRSIPRRASLKENGNAICIAPACH